MKVKSNFAKYIFIIFIIGIIILVAYKLNEEKKNTSVKSHFQKIHVILIGELKHSYRDEKYWNL